MATPAAETPGVHGRENLFTAPGVVDCSVLAVPSAASSGAGDARSCRGTLPVPRIVVRDDASAGAAAPCGTPPVGDAGAPAGAASRVVKAVMARTVSKLSAGPDPVGLDFHDLSGPADSRRRPKETFSTLSPGCPDYRCRRSLVRPRPLPSFCVSADDTEEAQSLPSGPCGATAAAGWEAAFWRRVERASESQQEQMNQLHAELLEEWRHALAASLPARDPDAASVLSATHAVDLRLATADAEMGPLDDAIVDTESAGGSPPPQWSSEPDARCTGHSVEANLPCFEFQPQISPASLVPSVEATSPFVVFQPHLSRGSPGTEKTNSLATSRSIMATAVAHTWSGVLKTFRTPETRMPIVAFRKPTDSVSRHLDPAKFEKGKSTLSFSPRRPLPADEHEPHRAPTLCASKTWKTGLEDVHIAAEGAIMQDILQRPTAQLLFSTPTTGLFLFFTLLNTVFSAIENTKRLQHAFDSIGDRYERVHRYSYLGEGFCYIVFIIEILWRLAVMRSEFFSVVSWKRNTWDVIVALGTAAYFMTDTFPNLCMLRVFNAIYSIHFLQIESVQRCVAVVLKMEQLFWGSMPTLLSTLAFVLCIIILFAHLITYGLSVALRDREHTDVVFFLEGSYDSFSRTCATLFIVIADGVAWAETYDNLAHVSEALGALFFFYVAIMTVGVLNVLTGLCVDIAVQFSELNRHQQIKQLAAQEELYARKLRQIFEEGDIDGSGTLSWVEFKEHLGDPRVSSCLTTLDLDVSELHTLFMILDTEHKESVDVDDFVWGCLRLKGQAKSVDLCALLFEHRQLQRAWNASMSHITKMCAKLEKIGARADARSNSLDKPIPEPLRRRPTFDPSIVQSDDCYRSVGTSEHLC